MIDDGIIVTCKHCHKIYFYIHPEDVTGNKTITSCTHCGKYCGTFQKGLFSRRYLK